MKELSTTIHGLRLFELKIYRDERGFFVERYRKNLFHEMGITTEFVQDNHSRSAPRVLRGMHFQRDPAQSKLVSVARGAIFDVAVDLRKNSPTFGKWFGTELNEDNGRILWIPFGFAHGFCVLGDVDADVVYKSNGVYNPKTEGGLRWNDREVAITWPLKDPQVAPRDKEFPGLREVQPLQP
jgi:dTDP-4-dehydrorhamnose 3,5-epimerase